MASSEALTRTLRDVVLDVILFPVYWYTKGLLRMMNWVADTILASTRSLSLNVWLQNLFVPMYGRYDWQSRLISVFMRFVQIIGRLFALFLWSLGAFLLFILYLLLPLFLLGLFFYHGLGSLTA
jgi:hypothetical protein